MEHLTPPQQAFIKSLISRPGDIDALISIGSMPESDIYNGFEGDLIGIIKDALEHSSDQEDSSDKELQ